MHNIYERGSLPLINKLKVVMIHKSCKDTLVIILSHLDKISSDGPTTVKFELTNV